MSLNVITDNNLRLMYEDMIQEALWPTQVSTAIDVFATARYESDSRLKGTLDLSDYTSQSEYPLVCWRCTDVIQSGEYTTQTALWILRGVVKFAAVGGEDIDDSATSASRVLITDLGLAAAAIRGQLYDTRLQDGPFAINDTAVVTGQGSGHSYCVKDAIVGEPEVSIAPQGGEGESVDEWAADDRLGFNVWIGELPVDIELIVF